MVNAPLDKTTNVISENLAVDAKNADAVNTTIAIFATEELTEEEECDRSRLERQVERAFYDAGKALRQLSVAARKHKRSGLQTRQFVAHINCK